MTTTIAQRATSTVQLKGRMFSLTVLHILSSDLDAIQQQLIHLIKQAPKMFHCAPMVIDITHAANIDLQLDLVYQLLKKLLIVPVG
ncbi:MAG: hypothetical protein ACK4PR_04100, partial [Gammaproteobacteria bacterium]